MARSQPGTASYSGSVDSTPVSVSPFTIAAFFLPNNLTAGLAVVNLNHRETDLNWYYMDLRGDLAGDNLYFAASGSGGAAFAPSVSPTVGAWNHGCSVAVASNSRAVYLNGGNKGTNTANLTPDLGAPRFTIGAFRGSSSGSFFDGSLSKVAVWNVALTDDEVASLAAGANPRTLRRANLVLYAPVSGVRSPESDLVGGRILTTSNATSAEEKPGLIRGGWR